MYQLTNQHANVKPVTITNIDHHDMAKTTDRDGVNQSAHQITKKRDSPMQNSIGIYRQTVEALAKSNWLTSALRLLSVRYWLAAM